MKIIEHKPEPVVTPPTTYDITGLSGEEIRVLRYFAARTTSSAAQRFLDKTAHIPVADWSPDKCFK